MKSKTMNSFLFLFVFSATIIFYGCASQPSAVSKGISKTTSSEENLIFPDNSQNSLDWQDTYSGIVPCADCEGIETTITLNQDLTFSIKTKYLGKSDKAFENTGKFTWNEKGTTITLVSLTDSASQYFVGENTLTQLDIEGNKILGNLAEKYMLKKETSAIMPISENSETEVSIIGIKWKLVELMGKPIDAINRNNKEPFLQLFADGKMAAYAGCNNMRGSYELKEGSRISFSNILSTKMACENMETEKVFAEILGKVDSYVINGNTLSLNRSRMSPLARFEAIK
jgi:uncharacterized lipoprotein NlpE involved in copper resistance